jgi:cytochrome P450
MREPYHFGSREYCLNPYPFLEECRSGTGIYKLPGEDGYLLTRYDDVVGAARCPEVFSSFMPSTDGIDVDGQHYPYIRTVPKYDAPDHGPIRALAMQAFTPARTASYEPLIQRHIDTLITQFESSGSVEFVSEYAVPLPMIVISQILGLPLDGIRKYKEWTGALAFLQSGYTDLDGHVGEAENSRSFGEVFTFLSDQVADRRANPGEDALSLVVNPPEGSDLPRLGHVELVGVAASLLTAGNETTTLMLENLMYRLATDADRKAALLADRSGVRNFVEECLRMDSPLQFLPRTCMVDHRVSGVVIPAGARVLLMWGAANRDSQRFDASAEFNGKRGSLNRHIAFGNGAHFCIGAPLARLEGRLTMDSVLTRLRNPRLDGPDAARRIVSAVSCGFTELHLKFDPPDSAVVGTVGRSRPEASSPFNTDLKES